MADTAKQMPLWLFFVAGLVALIIARAIVYNVPGGAKAF